LNNLPVANVPGLEIAKLEGAIQIARRSRIFALTFSGDVQCWRLGMATASGETFTPRFAGGTDPMVSALVPGTMWHALATEMQGPQALILPAAGGEGTAAAPQYAVNILPLIIDPNWELSPNEQLIFRGSPVRAAFMDPTQVLMLEIGVHAWEFPNMFIGSAGPACPPRMAGGPSSKGG
jgi:hypothetical protein